MHEFLPYLFFLDIFQVAMFKLYPHFFQSIRSWLLAHMALCMISWVSLWAITKEIGCYHFWGYFMKKKMVNFTQILHFTGTRVIMQLPFLPVKQPQRIWLNGLLKSTGMDNVTQTVNPCAVYSRYISVGGVQAMVPRYKWERDISGICYHEPGLGTFANW